MIIGNNYIRVKIEKYINPEWSKHLRQLREVNSIYPTTSCCYLFRKNNFSWKYHQLRRSQGQVLIGNPVVTPSAPNFNLRSTWGSPLAPSCCFDSSLPDWNWEMSKEEHLQWMRQSREEDRKSEEEHEIKYQEHLRRMKKLDEESERKERRKRIIMELIKYVRSEVSILKEFIEAVDVEVSLSISSLRSFNPVPVTSCSTSRSSFCIGTASSLRFSSRYGFDSTGFFGKSALRSKFPKPSSIRFRFKKSLGFKSLLRQKSFRLRSHRFRISLLHSHSFGSIRRIWTESPQLRQCIKW